MEMHTTRREIEREGNRPAKLRAYAPLLTHVIDDTAPAIVAKTHAGGARTNDSFGGPVADVTTVMASLTQVFHAAQPLVRFVDTVILSVTQLRGTHAHRLVVAQAGRMHARRYLITTKQQQKQQASLSSKN